MTIYTVHIPPRLHSRTEEALQARFVPEGFVWAAFVGGPLWLFRHRLWARFFAWLFLVGVLFFLTIILPVSPGVFAIGLCLLSLYMGMEGAEWRRRKLFRRGWKPVEVVVASTKAEGEAMFLTRWLQETRPSVCRVHPHVPPVDPVVVGPFMGHV